jgi:thiol-disulfide isomerase/thioredoxin
MKNILVSLMVVFGLSTSANAQLPDGSIAPDFTIQDLDGNWHHLYNYLAEGKVVFIKFFACHCPSCWAYQNTGKLEDLTLNYGPNGTDQVVVLMLEHDPNNGMNEFYGNSNWSQGDWVTGNPNPIFNVEGNDRSIFNDYNMTYYPMIYKICPDKTTKLMSTGLSVAQLYQEADDCPGTLSVSSDIEIDDFNAFYANGKVVYPKLEQLKALSIVNSIGQQMVKSEDVDSGLLDVSNLSSGVYFVQAVFNQKTTIQRVFIP